MDWLQLFAWGVDRVAGAAEGAAEGRISEGELANQRAEIARKAIDDLNRGNLELFNQILSAGRLELEQRQFQLKAPDARMMQVIRGDLMANPQDVELEMPSDVPEFNFTGGLKPSALGPNSRAFGRELSRQALINQMPSGPTSTGTAGIVTGPGGPGPSTMLPRERPERGGSPYVGNERRGDGGTGLRGHRGIPTSSAREIATAAPEDVAGSVTPLSGPSDSGRIIPRGDVFAPMPQPPSIYGFGGTTSGTSSTAGPGGRLTGPGGRSGPGPGAPASFGSRGGPSGGPGYGTPSGLEGIGIAESGPGSGTPGWLRMLTLLGPGGMAAYQIANQQMRNRPRNINQTRPYYGQEQPVPPYQDSWTQPLESWNRPGMEGYGGQQGPQGASGFTWNIPNF